ncbi:hypothetical protein [Rhodococcus sp. AQ5-07]|uniref:hypothetical protein n=1 Tax=Rhodococcus sp. AQ5-07 TaxID=2054902 RepID=UPI000DC01685|nr:hypothetical protein [Rhodococcus sp. AQ5-07]RAL31153.1 hypothetical protein CVN56_29735 [Rhodococcus sp. AQ5-07]
MKAARVPADAAVPVKDFLQVQLAVSEPGVHVALSLDDDWVPETNGVASTPAVVVFDDSGPMKWPISTHPQIRITVWSNSRTRSRTIAGKCLGWLLALHVPGVAYISAGTTLIDDLDPQNGGRMASFTVNTTVRTLPL